MFYKACKIQIDFAMGNVSELTCLQLTFRA